MLLSKLQCDAFKAQGFLVLRQFLDPFYCDSMLHLAQKDLFEAIEPLETEEGYSKRDKAYRTSVRDYLSHSPKSHNIRRLRQVYERNTTFSQWMTALSMRPVLEALLGDKAVLITAHHNSIMNKNPETSQATSWHQDVRYWHYSNNNLLSVWLALGEETPHNGGLEFIPKSHNMKFTALQFDAKEYFKEELEENKKLIKKKISLVLEKGDVVLFHASLLHRANKNSSDKVKISFVYTVKAKRTKTIGNTRSSEFPEILLDDVE
jgi:phytanoyl-CoA hydroxylase